MKRLLVKWFAFVGLPCSLVAAVLLVLFVAVPSVPKVLLALGWLLLAVIVAGSVLLVGVVAGIAKSQHTTTPVQPDDATTSST